MPDHVIPEIKRTSLTSVVLTLKCLAIHDVIRYVGNHEQTMDRMKEAWLFLRNCCVLFGLSLRIETNIFPGLVLTLAAFQLNQKC